MAKVKPKYDPLRSTVDGTLRIQRVGTLIQDDGSSLYLSEDVLKSAAKDYINRPVKLGHDGEIVGVVTSSYFDSPFIKGTYRLFEGFHEKIDFDEVSAGYFCQSTPDSGIWVDHLGAISDSGLSYKYDSVAKKIVPDHVAIVLRGRAGENVSLNLDDSSNLNKMARQKISQIVEEIVEEQELEVAEEVTETPIVNEEPVVEEPIAEEPIVEEPIAEVVNQPLETTANNETSSLDTLLKMIELMSMKIDSLTVEKKEDSFNDKFNKMFTRRYNIVSIAKDLLPEEKESDLISMDEDLLIKKLTDSLSLELDETVDPYSALATGYKFAKQLNNKKQSASPNFVKAQDSAKLVEKSDDYVTNSDGSLTYFRKRN
jgi:hypothetical protein